MFDESVRVTECFVASHYSRNRVSRRVARAAMNFRAIKIGHHEITLNYILGRGSLRNSSRSSENVSSFIQYRIK